jgi:uncharacterized membrane protein YdcZ (DUF606 family)
MDDLVPHRSAALPLCLLILGVVADHFGLVGPEHRLTLPRAIGVLCVVIGLLLYFR